MIRPAGFLGAITLGGAFLMSIASCAHPVEQVMQANLAARQQEYVSDAKISMGASDDVGLYIARDRAIGTLTMKPTMPTGIYLANR